MVAADRLGDRLESDLMRKKTKYTAEKQAAVLAALLEGQSVMSVSREYKIPHSTISQWKKKYSDGSRPKAVEISDLLLEYLETNLATLQAQAAFFSNIDWLEKQGAADLAVLHGVMTDKTIRILEAYGKHESD